MRNIVALALCGLALAACGQKSKSTVQPNPDMPPSRTNDVSPRSAPIRDHATEPPFTGSLRPSGGTVPSTDRDRTFPNSAPPATGTVPSSPPRDVDNTGVNERDKSGATVLPGDQKNTEADIKLTADIRKRIVDTKLSVDAQNVKVVTVDGRVTLRGPVKSQTEKDELVRIAKEVAGDANVDDQIEIEAEKPR